MYGKSHFVLPEDFWRNTFHKGDLFSTSKEDLEVSGIMLSVFPSHPVISGCRIVPGTQQTLDKYLLSE